MWEVVDLWQTKEWSLSQKVEEKKFCCVLVWIALKPGKNEIKKKKKKIGKYKDSKIWLILRRKKKQQIELKVEVSLAMRVV